MRKLLLFLSPLILASVVFSLVVFFSLRSSVKGALQVTSRPKSQVFLNDKIIGQTPLCKCDSSNQLAQGEYTIRLVPLEGSYSAFSEKIKITKGVMTVVDRTFGKEATSEGSIIGLSPIGDSKSLELLVISFPDNAKVYIDSNLSGNTPLLFKNLTESDHEVKLVKEGYREKNIRIRTVLGYKLTALAFLGINLEALNATPASNLGSGIQTATPSATPLKPKVIILQTPTGFLRVREDSNLNSAEISKVYPNETYEFLEEKDGWLKIKLNDDKTGWISAQYAQKQ